MSDSVLPIPIPGALYPCKICYTDYLWPAKNLYWCEKDRSWICGECWDEEMHGKKGIRLDQEIQRQAGLPINEPGSPEELLNTAIGIFGRPHDTSISLWIAYWRCRVWLREVAMKKYNAVHAAYFAEKIDAGLPSEGFKEIAQDDTHQMKTIRGETQ